MIENIPVALLNGLGLMGGIVFIFYMVATGKAGTPTQLKDKNEEIRWLRQTNKEQRDSIDTLSKEMTTVIGLLNSIRLLAERRRDE